MKCKYCNADIEQDAQFCSNCGKDLSIFNKCVKCGELLDNDTVYCPHCGEKQPREKPKGKASSKKWLWSVVGLLLIGLAGGIAAITALESVEEDFSTGKKESLSNGDIKIEKGISIEDAIRVTNLIVKENDEYKGLSSPDAVNSIMEKYGYSYEKTYYVERDWDFRPLYYKNCLFAQSTRIDGEIWYSDVPTEKGEGVPSFVGIDGYLGNLIIAPFTESAFNDYLHQIETNGGKLIESSQDVKTYKINSIEINAYKSGVNGISYCIVISKN